MIKKWVFDLLVKDNKDVLGLLAYALYKHRKSDYAKGLRLKGNLSEDEINNKMQLFHEQAVTGTNPLDSYRNEALLLMREIENRLIEPIHKEHEDEKNALIRQHKNNLRKQEDEILKKIKAYSVSKIPWHNRFMMWLVSEIPKGIASILIMIFILGIILSIAPPETKTLVVDQILQKYVNP